MIMKKCVNGEYFEMTKEEIEAFKEKHKSNNTNNIVKENNITLNERIEALEEALLDLMGVKNK